MLQPAPSDEAPPALTYAAAMDLGPLLADQFALLAAEKHGGRDDLVWADLVQFIIRKARDISVE